MQLLGDVCDPMYTIRSLVKRSKMRRGSCDHLLVTVLLFCTVKLMHISKANAALHRGEENILKVLRETMNIPNWTGDPCRENWIVCSENSTLQRVLSLNLEKRNLTGTIPSDIAKLQNISTINFGTNLLTGPIPDMSNLTNLTTLNLFQNKLSGSIPASLFQLKSLVHVDLHVNRLNGSIPESLENMVQATYINLRSNLLEGRLPNMTGLVKLKEFDASRNGLIGPFPDLRNSKDLIGLSINNNFLSGPGASLFQYPKLQWLYIANNSVEPGPIPDWTHLSNLWTISARLCNFQGVIPSLENKPSLTQLSIQLNNLTSMPSDLRNLTFLKTLEVSDNIISGKLPDLPSSRSQPSAMAKLTKIDLSNNSFSGEIPSSWSELFFLEDMNLGMNNLSGVIPKGIGRLRSLIKLNLSNNFFTGPIPEEITFLEDLQSLDLRNNKLTGIVPESLLNLSKLQSLYVGNNSFVGIPAALALKQGLNVSLGDTKILFPEAASPAPSKGTTVHVGLVVGTSLAGLAILAAILFLITRRRKVRCELSKEDMPKSAKAFSLKQIKQMTQGFKRLIGKGGFGPVYYGKLPNGKEVAVKVRAMDSKQGAKEFLNEVQLLSRLHHRSLVPLVGYCLDAQEQILVYTYMPQGTLHDHLHHLSGPSSSNPRGSGGGPEPSNSFVPSALDWKTRLDIATNSARGLEYLHKDCNPPVIHRDVKSSNILLTEKLEAKFGDLGISKQAVDLDAEEAQIMSGITTGIKGTLGYLDPEYFIRQRLTTKSDVYSFGIILLEIVTGKRAQSMKFYESDARSLKEWVEGAVSENNHKSIVDPALNSEYNEEGMLLVIVCALSCLCPNGSERPEMGYIVRTLHEASQMEKKLESGQVDSEGPDDITSPLSGQLSVTSAPESAHFSSISTAFNITLQSGEFFRSGSIRV